MAELFRRYAAGTTTVSRLASWLNEQGFRTRNMHRLPDAEGGLVAGRRMFTISSVRGILHNAFYSGRIRHGAELLPGAHEPLVSLKLFNQVQEALRRNSGRSETLQAHPEREYLLKGLVRCAYCRMPMWAQTYKNGRRYYREHAHSRSLMACPAGGGSIPGEVADDQVGRLVTALVLPEAWMDRILARIQIEDENQRVEGERVRVQERLRRLGRAYVDGLYSDQDYQRQKRELEEHLVGLVVPEMEATQQAGRLLEDLPQLWAEAILTERRRLLLTLLEAVYIDAKDEHRVVAIRPKPAFRPLLEIAATREGSGVILVTEPLEGPAEESDALDTKPPGDDPEADTNPCCWWRRGGVEPPVQETV